MKIVFTKDNFHMFFQNFKKIICKVVFVKDDFHVFKSSQFEMFLSNFSQMF